MACTPTVAHQEKNFFWLFRASSLPQWRQQKTSHWLSRYTRRIVSMQMYPVANITSTSTVRDSHENKMKNLQILSPSSSSLKWYFWYPIVYFIPVQIQKHEETLRKLYLTSVYALFIWRSKDLTQIVSIGSSLSWDFKVSTF